MTEYLSDHHAVTLQRFYRGHLARREAARLQLFKERNRLRSKAHRQQLAVKRSSDSTAIVHLDAHPASDLPRQQQQESLVAIPIERICAVENEEIMSVHKNFDDVHDLIEQEALNQESYLNYPSESDGQQVVMNDQSHLANIKTYNEIAASEINNSVNVSLSDGPEVPSVPSRYSNKLHQLVQYNSTATHQHQDVDLDVNSDYDHDAINGTTQPKQHVSSASRNDHHSIKNCHFENSPEILPKVTSNQKLVTSKSRQSEFLSLADLLKLPLTDHNYDLVSNRTDDQSVSTPQKTAWSNAASIVSNRVRSRKKSAVTYTTNCSMEQSSTPRTDSSNRCDHRSELGYLQPHLYTAESQVVKYNICSTQTKNAQEACIPSDAVSIISSSTRQSSRQQSRGLIQHSRKLSQQETSSQPHYSAISSPSIQPVIETTYSTNTGYSNRFQHKLIYEKIENNLPGKFSAVTSKDIEQQNSDIQFVPNTRKMLMARQMHRERATVTMQRVVRGWLARRLADRRRALLSNRFTCTRCGRMQMPGIYCKGCGRKVPPEHRPHKLVADHNSIANDIVSSSASTGINKQLRKKSINLQNDTDVNEVKSRVTPASSKHQDSSRIRRPSFFSGLRSRHKEVPLALNIPLPSEYAGHNWTSNVQDPRLSYHHNANTKDSNSIGDDRGVISLNRTSQNNNFTQQCECDAESAEHSSLRTDHQIAIKTRQYKTSLASNHHDSDAHAKLMQKQHSLQRYDPPNLELSLTAQEEMKLLNELLELEKRHHKGPATTAQSQHPLRSSAYTKGHTSSPSSSSLNHIKQVESSTNATTKTTNSKSTQVKNEMPVQHFIKPTHPEPTKSTILLVNIDTKMIPTSQTQAIISETSRSSTQVAKENITATRLTLPDSNNINKNLKIPTGNDSNSERQKLAFGPGAKDIKNLLNCQSRANSRTNSSNKSFSAHVKSFSNPESSITLHLPTANHVEVANTSIPSPKPLLDLLSTPPAVINKVYEAMYVGTEDSSYAKVFSKRVQPPSGATSVAAVQRPTKSSVETDVPDDRSYTSDSKAKKIIKLGSQSDRSATRLVTEDALSLPLIHSNNLKVLKSHLGRDRNTVSTAPLPSRVVDNINMSHVHLPAVTNNSSNLTSQTKLLNLLTK